MPQTYQREQQDCIEIYVVRSHSPPIEEEIVAKYASRSDVPIHPECRDVLAPNGIVIAVRQFQTQWARQNLHPVAESGGHQVETYRSCNERAQRVALEVTKAPIVNNEMTSGRQCVSGGQLGRRQARSAPP